MRRGKYQLVNRKDLLKHTVRPGSNRLFLLPQYTAHTPEMPVLLFLVLYSFFIYQKQTLSTLCKEL